MTTIKIIKAASPYAVGNALYVETTVDTTVWFEIPRY